MYRQHEPSVLTCLWPPIRISEPINMTWQILKWLPKQENAQHCLKRFRRMQFLLHSLKSYYWYWRISLKSSISLRHLCVSYFSQILQLEIMLTDEKIKLVLIMNSTTNTLIHSTPISDTSNSCSSCNVLLATETRKDIKLSCHEIKWTEYFDSVAKLYVYVMYMRFLMSILEIASQNTTCLHTVITNKFSINVKWKS